MKWTCFTKPPLTTTCECLHSNDQTSEAKSEKEGTWKINVDKETPSSIKEIHPECKSTLSGGESGRNPANQLRLVVYTIILMGLYYVSQVVQDVFNQQYLMDSCSI